MCTLIPLEVHNQAKDLGLNDVLPKFTEKEGGWKELNSHNLAAQW